MGDGGFISGILGKIAGKTQQVEEIQEEYAGAIRTGSSF